MLCLLLVGLHPSTQGYGGIDVSTVEAKFRYLAPKIAAGTSGGAWG